VLPTPSLSLFSSSTTNDYYGVYLTQSCKDKQRLGDRSGGGELLPLPLTFFECAIREEEVLRNITRDIG